MSFEVPVTANDEPGITVSAAFVRDGVFHTGSKYVRAPPVEHQLNVKVRPTSRSTCRARRRSTRVEATGGDGKPAPRAEFSLGVVDEAIYGIRQDTTPDILDFFFAATTIA